MNRTLISLAATFGGLSLTVLALLGMFAACVFGNLNPAELFAADLGVTLIVGFIAGVVLAVAGAIGLLMLNVPPSKPK